MRWRISWLKKPWGCKTSIGQMQSQLVEEERLLLIFCCPEIFREHKYVKNLRSYE